MTAGRHREGCPCAACDLVVRAFRGEIGEDIVGTVDPGMAAAGFDMRGLPSWADGSPFEGCEVRGEALRYEGAGFFCYPLTFATRDGAGDVLAAAISGEIGCAR